MGKNRTLAHPASDTHGTDAVHKPSTSVITSKIRFDKTTLVMGLKIGSLVSFLLILYAQDLVTVFREALYAEASSYLLAIPIFLAYLVYRKRKILSPIIQNPSLEAVRKDTLAFSCGVLLCATSVFLYWYGSYTFDPLEYHMLTFPIFTAGLIIVLFDYALLRQLAFSVFFMIFLVPPRAQLLYGVGSVLSLTSASISTAFMNLLGMPSATSFESGNPVVVMTRPDQTTARFGIDISCSGIYGLITFMVFSLFLAYLVRDKLWKKVTLVLAGLPLIYALNIIRISTLLTIGYHYGEDIAQTLFHSISGIAFTFAGALLLVLTAQKLLKTNFSKTPTPQGCPNCSTSQGATPSFCQTCGKHLKNTRMKLMKKDVAKMVTVATIIVLLLLVQSPISALVKAPTNLLDQLKLGQEPTTSILPQVSNCSLQFEYRDTEFEQHTGQDGTLTYSYAPADVSQDKVWIVMEIANSESSFHNWEFCLITWPLNQNKEAPVTQLDLKDVQIMQNPPLIARCFAFRWNSYNNTQVVVYWRETIVFTSNNETQQKNVQVSLSIYPNHPEQITQSEDALEKVAESIAAYWEPLRTWTPVALLLSKNANILAASSTAALALVIPVEVLKKRNKKAGKKLSHGKIADEDKRILISLGNLQRKNLSTLDDLKQSYQKLNNLDIDEHALEARLQELSRIGLAYQEIRSVDDDPVLVWKTSIF